MSEHVLKVQPPYFDALLDGSKTFEVRKNDRAYQRGDTLVLREFVVPAMRLTGREIRKRVSFVYAGDPRFGGIEQGHVVLALTDFPTPAETPTESAEEAK